MISLTCPAELAGDTIDHLQAAGRRRHERLVLWLTASPAGQSAVVDEIYDPEQETAADRFHLPPASMRMLMTHLRARRLRIAAQVHSHPQLAFHSVADDRWAIVRHRGALSLVLPFFASATTIGNFLEEAKTFELSAENHWLEVPNFGPHARVEIRR